MPFVAPDLMSDVPENIQSPVLRRLYAYWDERRRGRLMPARRDLDPLDFSFALGHVLLIDVLENPRRFRFRLHGSELVSRAGYDMTGKMVDELPDPENRSVLLRRCRELVNTRQPYAQRSERIVDDRMMRYEVVWMPLSDDGERVTMLFGALIYLDPPFACGRSVHQGRCNPSG